MVSDDGDPILSSTTTITLTVTDVNDNPPELMLTEFSLSTSVDTAPGYLPHFALPYEKYLNVIRKSVVFQQQKNSIFIYTINMSRKVFVLYHKLRWLLYVPFISFSK